MFNEEQRIVLRDQCSNNTKKFRADWKRLVDALSFKQWNMRMSKPSGSYKNSLNGWKKSIKSKKIQALIAQCEISLVGMMTAQEVYKQYIDKDVAI